MGAADGMRRGERCSGLAVQERAPATHALCMLSPACMPHSKVPPVTARARPLAMRPEAAPRTVPPAPRAAVGSRGHGLSGMQAGPRADKSPAFLPSLAASRLQPRIRQLPAGWSSSPRRRMDLNTEAPVVGSDTSTMMNTAKVCSGRGGLARLRPTGRQAKAGVQMQTQKGQLTVGRAAACGAQHCLQVGHTHRSASRCSIRPTSAPAHLPTADGSQRQLRRRE